MSKIEQYKPNKIEGRFNISPSSMYAWNENPAAWARSYIDGKRFESNTNTVFGTIVHAGIEQHFNGEVLSQEDVSAYLETFPEGADIDHWYIMDMFEKTIEVVVGELTKPDKQEYVTSFLPKDGFSIGGTADYRRGSVIGDYKTTKAKKSSLGLYYYQLMTLAYADKMNGVETTHLEVVYIVKPSKGKPSEAKNAKAGAMVGVKAASVSIVEHEITEQDWIDIEVFLKTVIKTVSLYQENNSLRDVLWRENNGSFIK